MLRRFSILVSVAAALGLPAAADMVAPEVAADSYWGIGATGIMCARSPCPWRGLFVIDPDNPRPPQPGAITPLLPRLSGSEAHVEAIETAWADFLCVKVLGHFADGVLVVADVSEGC